MVHLRPDDPEVLATAVVDSLVVAADDRMGPTASGFYWHNAKPWVEAVVAAVAALGDDRVDTAATALRCEPGSYGRYQTLRRALVHLADRDPDRLTEAFDAGWLAEVNSRLGYRIGQHHDATAANTVPADLTALIALPMPIRTTLPRDSPVLVVVPFRDRGAGDRARNLVACLLALRDQSFNPRCFGVTVVETDDAPRWEDVVRPRCDHYLFAPKPGPFNKSWAVNVGVVHTPGEPELVCVLDADVLPDRDFIARNVKRFLSPGVGAVSPYRDMACLDPAASAHAIHQRLVERRPAPDPVSLRAFLVRRPPGLCLWLRYDAFRRVGGMDERYEGWGGEDNDFFFRVDRDTPLDRYDDPILHLYHLALSSLVDGRVENWSLTPLSWPPDSEIGRLDRFGMPGG